VAQPLIYEHPEAAAALLTPTPRTLISAANLARVLDQQLPAAASGEQLRRCARVYALAAALEERLRREVLQRPDSQLQHGAKAANLLPGQLGILRRLYEREKDPNHLRAAFTALEQNRARVFLEGLGEANAGRLAGLLPELQTEEDQLHERLRLCDARLQSARDQPGPNAAVELQLRWREQQQAENDLRQFAQRVAHRYPQYANLRFPVPCTLAEACACLDPNEVALLFAIGPDTSYVLLLPGTPAQDDSAEGLALYPLPGRRALQERVQALTQREELELPDGGRDLGAELYSLLLAPWPNGCTARTCSSWPTATSAMCPSSCWSRERSARTAVTTYWSSIACATRRR
jgi:hypothetical protein